MTFEDLPDGGVLAGGVVPGQGIYEITALTDVSRITGIRLEALKDPSLPGDGPGFYPNGNFMLTEITLDAHPASEPATFALLGIAFAGLGLAKRRKRDAAMEDQRVMYMFGLLRQMALRLKFTGMSSRLAMLLVGIMASYLPSSSVAHAELILTMESVTASAGSSGNAFDVELINTGPVAVAVGAFTFGIATANPNISFTDASTATVLAPYIFAGDSLFGPDLTGPTSGQSLTASDLCAVCAGISLAAGTTVGLGHVLFDVSSSASGGVFAVNFAAFPATSLSDTTGDLLPATFAPGAITVPGAVAVPEPTSLLLLLLAGVILAVGFTRSRKMA
jgi:PEP-CTERM motif